MRYISRSLSSSREKRITAVKTVTKDFAEQNRTPRRAFENKAGVVVSREKSTERERTRKRLNDDDLIGFVRDNKQTKTNKLLWENFF